MIDDGWNWSDLAKPPAVSACDAVRDVAVRPLIDADTWHATAADTPLDAICVAWANQCRLSWVKFGVNSKPDQFAILEMMPHVDLFHAATENA